MKRLVLLGLLPVLSASLPASAAVYRCQLPGGQVSFQGVPCTSGQERPVDVAESIESGVSASAPMQSGAEPEVVGSAAFQARVQQALALLKVRDPAAHAIVKAYVGRIEQAARSGMRAYVYPPTFFLTDAAANYSVTWAAAVIAHDSYHSKLYHDYHGAHPGEEVPRRVWAGIESEVKCMKHQMAVMRRIGASQREIDHALANADGHYGSDRGVR